MISFSDSSKKEPLQDFRMSTLNGTDWIGIPACDTWLFT